MITLALTLALSPEEREQPARVPVLSDNRPANPVACYFRDAGSVKALSLGRGLGEGGRKLKSSAKDGRCRPDGGMALT